MNEPRLVPLLSRDGSVFGYALVDEEDVAALAGWTWRLMTNGYAVRCVGTKNVYMHRQLLGLEEGNELQGDHINRNRLDNRRANLRIVTHAEQNHNARPRRSRSQHRGVSWWSDRKKWRAEACLGGKRTYIGSFDTEEEAAEAVSMWRTEHMSHAVEEQFV